MARATSPTARIVVLGAGYAGMSAARRLARLRPDAHIDLVNARGDFVERVRLHQLAAGTGSVTHPLGAALAGTSVRPVVDRVTGLDPDARRVTLADRPALQYDTLIYALGSHTGVDRVPGVAEHAYTLDDVASATRLAGALAALPTARPGAGSATGRLVVCGGGLTGIEAATELAEAHPGLHVELVTAGEIGHSVSPRARQYARRVLARLGVRVREHTRVERVTGTAVRLADGDELAADATLWCGSFEVPSLAADAGLSVDESGRVLVDATMRSRSHPDVYAVGDAAAIGLPWGPQRMSCQAGAPSGGYAADALAARLAGRRPAPYRFRYLSQCVSLGRRDGFVQLTHADDSPARTVLTGRAAARVKEYICRVAAWMPRAGYPSPRLMYPRGFASEAHPAPAPHASDTTETIPAAG